MNNRDLLRSRTLGGSSAFKTQIIKHDGCEYQLRQMSIRSRGEIGKKSMDEKGAIDPFAWRLHSLIECVFDPQSGEKVFDDADYEMLSELPADCFIDAFSEALAEMTNVSTQTAKKPLGKMAKKG